MERRFVTGFPSSHDWGDATKQLPQPGNVETGQVALLDKRVKVRKSCHCFGVFVEAVPIAGNVFDEWSEKASAINRTFEVSKRSERLLLLSVSSHSLETDLRLVAQINQLSQTEQSFSVERIARRRSNQLENLFSAKQLHLDDNS